MTYSVQLIIGRGEAVARFLSRWAGARAVELKGGWQAVPVEDELFELIGAAYPGKVKTGELDMAPAGLMEALVEATTAGGGIAYVETEYWGGSGNQSAVAFVDGREAYGPLRATGASGPINGALRAIGVARAGADDEFDTIGLGERRTMDDYSPERPRRLRGAGGPKAAPPGRHLPMWMVIVIIILAIAMGVSLASG